MNLKLYLSIFFILIISCKNPKIRNEQNTIDQSEISILLKSLKDSSIAQNDISTQWQKLNELDTIAIRFFNEKLNSTECIDWGGVPKPLKGMVLSIPCRADFQSLFFITALYYNDYYFSFNNMFYDTTFCIYDSIKKSYSLESPLEYSVISDDKIKKASIVIRKWISFNNGKTLSEIRKGPRPFYNSPYYWFGEKGAKINYTNFAIYTNTSLN